MFQDIGLSKDVLNKTLKAQATKAKIDNETTSEKSRK
jgi:hypothetical protein